MALSCREKIISEDYVDWILDFPLEEILDEVEGRYDYCYQQVDGRIGILSINRNNLADMSLLSNDYYAFPDLLGLQQVEQEGSIQGRRGFGQEASRQNMQGLENGGNLTGMNSPNELETPIIASNEPVFDPSPLIQSGITRVQGEPLNLTGRGVILAFADTGINYQNRIFQREDGSSRILAIWDQTIQDGEPPEGFLYGTEYTREEIDRALQAERVLSEGTKQQGYQDGRENEGSEARQLRARDIVPSVDENGHGTRLAALAAGSQIENGSVYNSPAYGADILVVKVRGAKQYLKEYYQIPDSVAAYSSADMMMAIKYLNSYARAFQRPIVFCIGMGTNFRDHESGGVFSRYLNAIATQRSRVMVIAGGNEGNSAHHYRGSFQNGRQNVTENMEVYVSEGVNGFLMEIWTEAPVNLSVSIRTPGGEFIDPFSVLFQDNLRYRFVFEQTVITVYNAYIAQGSGDALVLIRFESPTPGVWTIGVADEANTPGAKFDAWLPISEFLENQVYFLEPQPEITLTTPSYVPDAIAVTAYNSNDNSIYQNSGRGFSRDARIKPDLSAPGVDITVAGNRLGENPRIGIYTGTSLAAAITAGAAAQFMQWAVINDNAPYIRSQEVKNYLIRGAIRERNIEYPNPIWGWGRLDLYNTFVSMQNR